MIMTAGGFLLIFKRKAGIYISIIGLASFPAYLYSFYHVLAYGDFYLEYYSVPSMTLIFGPPLAMLIVGRKRTNWN